MMHELETWGQLACSLGREAGLRRSGPNAQHCTFTGGRKNEEGGGGGENARGEAGVDRQIAQQVLHNPSLGGQQSRSPISRVHIDHQDILRTPSLLIYSLSQCKSNKKKCFLKVRPYHLQKVYIITLKIYLRKLQKCH